MSTHHPPLKSLPLAILFTLCAALLLPSCTPEPPQAAEREPTVPLAPLPEPAATIPEPAVEAPEPEPAAPTAEPTSVTETPAGVVADFYRWYLDYFGDRTGAISANPLADGAYRDAPMLGESFVSRVDELLAEMRAAEGGGYDPFLCAQNVPEFINPEVTFHHAQTGEATVLVSSSFANQRFTVDLQPAGGGWVISNITCASSPEGTARAFYTWYLALLAARGEEGFQSPLTARIYRESPLLAPELVEKIDRQLAEMESEDARGGADPFLLAQDVPQDFTVDPGRELGTAVVHLYFGPDSIQHLLLTTEQQGSTWPITGITLNGGLPSSAPLEDGQNSGMNLFVAADFGFSFLFPDSWAVLPLPLEGPGRPSDWPVAAAWQLMPAGLAERMSAGGPPDPQAPPLIVPFEISVIVGDEQDVARVLGDLNGETVRSGEHEATLLRLDPGYTHAIFAHPEKFNTWIVLTDWVTTFPGREDLGEAAAPVWTAVLESLRFTE